MVDGARGIDGALNMQVVADEGGKKKDVEFVYNSSKKSLTVKNPDVNISADWVITIA